MDVNISDAIERDEDFQQGFDEYRKLEQKANSVAEELSISLIENIVKNNDNSKFNLTTAILAVSKTLSHLTSYMYENEEQFLTDVHKARTSVVSDIIPALLNPQPCGLCDECKNGNLEACLNPVVRGDYTTSRFLPILANMLIEYDLFNKTIYMHTAGKMNDDEAIEDEAAEESKL